MTIKRIFDFAHHALENYSQDDMFLTKYHGEWKKTSTKDFCDQGNRISRGLLKLGIKPGDKIALITTATRTEWAVMDLGISQIGAVSVPVYPTISPEDYDFIFNNAEVQYCFVSDRDLYDKVIQIKANVSTMKGVFTFDKIDGAPNWNEILDLGNDDATQNEVDDLSNSINSEDLATIIYTSGTTGRPKGVMLTHHNIVSNVLASDPRIPRVKGLQNSDIRILSFLPICHIFERMLFYLYQFNGYSLYFAESIEKMGDNIKEVKPHIMSVVPRLIEKVYDKIYDKGTSAGGLKSKIFLWALGVNKAKQKIGKPSGLMETIADKLVFSKWREGLGGNIITLVSGSAALQPRLNKMFQNAGIPILEGYGLTETSPVISVNSFGKIKVGTVGHVLENLDVKIQEDGEITVKGPSVFKGYFKNEEMTKEVFTEDGYFKTGDIGHIDEEGYLTIAGSLIVDDSPVHHSRLFCTRWNGLNKSSGVLDALDEAEYEGSVIYLIENGEAFIKRNAKMMWRKTANSREEMPDYVERSYHEALVNAIAHRLSEASDKRCYEKKNIMRSRTRKFFFFALSCPINFS